LAITAITPTLHEFWFFFCLDTRTEQTDGQTGKTRDAAHKTVA